MNALTTLRKALVRAYTEVAHPGVGIASALLTAALCGAGTFLSKAVPDFSHSHFGSYWLALYWRPVWVIVVFTAVLVWCAHGAIRLGRVVSTKTGRRVLGLALILPQLGVALTVGYCLWFEIRNSDEHFVISASPTEVHGESYRALRVEASSRKRKHRRPIVAWLERTVGTTTEQLRVRRGQPWASESGAYRLALDHADIVTSGVILRHGRDRVELVPNIPVLSGTDTLILHDVQNPGTEFAQATPKADVSIGGQRVLLPLDPEWTGETALLSLKESPVLVLLVHRNVEKLLGALGVASLLAGMVFVILSPRRPLRWRR